MGTWTPRVGQALRADVAVQTSGGELPAGLVVVFWRSTYSPYDGEDCYFLIEREEFYRAPGKPSPGSVFGVHLPVGEGREGFERLLRPVDESTLPLARCGPEQAGPVVWWAKEEARMTANRGGPTDGPTRAEPS